MTKKRKAPKSQKQKSRSKRAGTKKQALQRLQDNIKSLEENKFNSEKFHNVLFDKLLADVDAKHHRDILLKICKNMNISSKKCKHKNAQELAELLRISIRYKSLKSYAIAMLVLLGGSYFGRHNLSRTTVATNVSTKKQRNEQKQRHSSPVVINRKLLNTPTGHRVPVNEIKVFYQKDKSILDMLNLRECILVDPAGTAFNPNGGGNYANAGYLSGAIYKKFDLVGQHHINLKETCAVWNNSMEGVVAIVHVIGPSKAEQYQEKLEDTFASLKDVLDTNNTNNHVIALPLISGGSFKPHSISLTRYMKIFIALIHKYLSYYKVVIGLYTPEEKGAYDNAVKE